MSLVNPNLTVYSFGKNKAILTTLDKSNTCHMINDAIGNGQEAEDVVKRINKLYGDGYAYVFPVVHHTDVIKPEYLEI